MLAATLRTIPEGTLAPGQINLAQGFYISPKLDGIRALTFPHGQVLSRTLKPIQNRTIHSYMARHFPPYLDGELIVPNAPFSDTSSLIMSRDTPALNWEYHVFDWHGDTTIPYAHRLALLQQKISSLPQNILQHIHITPQYLVHDEASLLSLEQSYLAQNHEGAMLRLHTAPYKYGRSTLRQAYLLKLKRFIDSEAIVLSTTQLFSNSNSPELNELGYTQRSSHLENLIPQPLMGALTVRALNGPYKDTTFNIGTGFTEAQRQAMHLSPPIGRIITFTYQACGSKDVPRIPVFKAFRED